MVIFMTMSHITRKEKDEYPISLVSRCLVSYGLVSLSNMPGLDDGHHLCPWQHECCQGHLYQKTRGRRDEGESPRWHKDRLWFSHWNTQGVAEKQQGPSQERRDNSIPQAKINTASS
ncbi:hypothetical protein KSD_29340 [Ktedonobacter sp. SOSP1-85]|nr:hypothetical protein KSD_29340 [Ktedonobacter sp. SOSP1-85]